MKKKESIILIAYTEAFISTLPYFTISAVIILLYTFFDIQSLKNISVVLHSFFPFILLISISNKLSGRYKMPQFIPVSLSLAIFLSAKSLTYGTFTLNLEFISNSYLTVLIIPLLVIRSLKLLTNKTQDYFLVNGELNNSIKYIYPSVLIFISITTLVVLLSLYIDMFFSQNYMTTSLPDRTLFVLRFISNHLLWLLGLHGGNFTEAVFGADFLNRYIFSNLTYKQYYDLFIISGGSGTGLALLLAVFITGKNKHSQEIARLATPFVLFNINEILIFGLPVIFNRYLCIPFLLVPSVNFIISCFVISFHPILIVNNEISWVTPIFINSYIATGGDFFFLGLQLLLLTTGTLIYIPFVNYYTSTQSSNIQRKSLSKKLDINFNLNSTREIKSYRAKREIIHSSIEVDKIINLISNETLFVYYQPIVDQITNDCNTYEALLRIKMPNGEIKGPFFLELLEYSGQATIIDIWVCQKVKDDIQSWREKGLDIKVSINLHPDTLADHATLSHIITILAGENIGFEIIERGLLETDQVLKNIRMLKENGFSISIDDFGTGFSSFEVLCTFPLDCLKIDKSIIDLVNTPKGFIACEHISKLCNAMQFCCLAEGVETEEQYKILSKLNIQYIQGFYYSTALPPEMITEHHSEVDPIVKTGKGHPPFLAHYS